MPNVDLGILVTAVDHASSKLKGVSDETARITKNAQAAHFQLRAINIVMANIALTKVFEMGKTFLNVSVQIDNVTRRLSMFTGGLKQSRDILDGFDQKFSHTGFQAEELAEQFIKLRSAGLDNKTTVDLLNAIGQSVSALGGSMASIENVTAGFARMSARGTVSLRDLNNAIGSNLPFALRAMADAAGLSIDRFLERTQKGLLSGKEAIDLFVRGASKSIGDFDARLRNTLGGSFNRLQFSMGEFVETIGRNTSIDERFILWLQRSASAIDAFAAAITESDIRALAGLFDGIVGSATRLVQALVPVARGLANIGAVLTQVLASVPYEILEYGFIMFLFLGKKGLGIGAVLGLLDSAIRGIQGAMISLYQTMGLVSPEVAKQNKEYIEQTSILGQLANAISGFVESVNKKVNPDMDGTLALIELQNRIAQSMQGLGAAATVPASGIDDVMNAIDQKLQSIQKRIHDVGGVMGVARSFGDEIAEGVAEIERRTQNWRDVLQGAILDLSQIEDANDQQKQAILNLQAAAGDIYNDIATAAKQLEDRFRLIANLRREQNVLEQRVLQSQLQQNAAVLAQQSNYSNLFNLVLGTTAGRIQQQIRLQQLQLQQDLASIQAKIKELEIDQKLYQADTNRVKAIEETIRLYKQLAKQTQSAMERLTPTMEITKQAAQDLGRVLEDGIGNGIADIITGTRTMGDVARQVYNEITKLAVQYLLKLVQIKAMGESGGGGSSGGSGFMSSIGAALNIWGLSSGGASGPNSFGGFETASPKTFMAANGAAFNGKVKAFANGDIISGPTMFGIAGEAGTEAIMPLKRVGGKLGVATDGGGGGVVANFHIHAIDTQTGTEWLRRNIDTIASQLNHKRRLNT